MNTNKRKKKTSFILCILFALTIAVFFPSSAYGSSTVISLDEENYGDCMFHKYYWYHVGKDAYERICSVCGHNGGRAYKVDDYYYEYYCDVSEDNQHSTCHKVFDETGNWILTETCGTQIWREEDDDSYYGSCKCHLCNIYVSKISKTSYVYNGSEKKPILEVKDALRITMPPNQYSITYENNINVGTGIVKVTYLGGFDGPSLEQKFVINPKATTQYNPKRMNNGFTVKWKKSTKANCTGYQIRYATNSKMTRAKRITVKGYDNTYKKVLNLKDHKKYYIQVRVYKTVNGKTYYSSWSTKKATTTW